MSWIKVDPEELVLACLTLAVVSDGLVAANARLYTARNTPGLGPANALVAAEFQAIGEALLGAADGLGTQAQDLATRAGEALRDQSAAAQVATVGGVASALGGPIAVGTVGSGARVIGPNTTFAELTAPTGPPLTSAQVYPSTGLGGRQGSERTIGPHTTLAEILAPTGTDLTGLTFVQEPTPSAQAISNNKLAEQIAVKGFIANINANALHNIGVSQSRMASIQAGVDPASLGRPNYRW